MAEHPLRVGLSMEVKVDTADQSGKTLADTQRTTPVAATAVFDEQFKAADNEVAHIIAANLGRKATAAVATAPSSTAKAANQAAAASAQRHASAPVQPAAQAPVVQ